MDQKIKKAKDKLSCCCFPLASFPFEPDVRDEPPHVGLDPDGGSEPLKPLPVHVGNEQGLDLHGRVLDALWHRLLGLGIPQRGKLLCCQPLCLLPQVPLGSLQELDASFFKAELG